MMRQPKKLLAFVLAVVLTLSVTPVHAARTGESSSSFTVAAGTAMAVSKSKTYRSITVQPGATLTVGLNGALTIQDELVVNGNLIVLGTISAQKLSASSTATMTFLGTKAEVDVSTSAALNTANVKALAGAEKPINAANVTGTDAAKALVRGDTSAPTSGACGENAVWRLDGDTLTISGTGRMADYPEDSPWKDLWFSIKHVVVNSGITYIGLGAFFNLNELEDVALPSTLTAIGAQAFMCTWSLKSVVIPEGVTTIGTQAFLSSDIRRITMPESIKSIGNSAFSGCDKLESVNYNGSPSGWEAVTIGSGNEPLTGATITYAKQDAPKTITYADVVPANKAPVSSSPNINNIDQVGAAINNMVRNGQTTLNLKYSTGLTSAEADTLNKTVLAYLQKYEGRLGLNSAVNCVYWTDGSVTLDGFTKRYDSANLSTGSQDVLDAAVDVVNEMHKSGAVTASSSQTEIAKVYFEYLCDNVKYVNDGNLCYTPYGALINGKAVCQGYTAAYNLLLAIEGIDAYGYEVPDYPGEGGHVRTVASLDGRDVCIDVTWGDQADGAYGRIFWKMFDLENWDLTDIKAVAAAAAAVA